MPTPQELTELTLIATSAELSLMASEPLTDLQDAAELSAIDLHPALPVELSAQAP